MSEEEAGQFDATMKIPDLSEKRPWASEPNPKEAYKQAYAKKSDEIAEMLPRLDKSGTGQEVQNIATEFGPARANFANRMDQKYGNMRPIPLHKTNQDS